MATAVQHQQQHPPPSLDSTTTPDHLDTGGAPAAMTASASTTTLDEFLNLPSPALLPAHAPKPSPPAQHRPTATTPKAAAAATPTATSLAQSAPIAAASLANGPPPPGSSPEVLFRYYLASELQRMGSPFDDSVIDKYVKQHTKTLDAARQAGSATANARLATSHGAGPSPITGATPISSSAAISGPSGGTTSSTTNAHTHTTAAQAPAVAVTPATLLSTLAPPPMAVSLAPSPFKHAAAGMATTHPGSIEPAAIFSPAVVGSATLASPPSINPSLVQLGSGKAATAASAMTVQPHAAQTKALKVEPRTPQLQDAHLMDESDGEDAIMASHNDGNEDQDDDDEDDEDDDHEMDTSRSGRADRSGSASLTTAMSPSTSMQSSKSSSSTAKKVGFGNVHPASASPASSNAGSNAASALGVPASLAAISEDMRPSAEEYRKLSSKEKRQLRNKISARNFRTRRKEYIGQLEDQIADRDQLIDGLRAQLAKLNVANAELEEEVKRLREQTISQTDVSRILEALQKSMSATAAPVPSEMAPSAAAAAAQAAVTLPTLAGAGPTLARTPMRTSTSSNSLSDLFGGIAAAAASAPSSSSVASSTTPSAATPSAAAAASALAGATMRPGTPMQTSRPSTPLSPLFPALAISGPSTASVAGSGMGASATAGAVAGGAGAGAGSLPFSPSTRPSLARRPSPAHFSLGSASSLSANASSTSLGSGSGSGSGASATTSLMNGSAPSLGHAGPITQPNTKKDVAPTVSADSFWAGSSSASSAGGGLGLGLGAAGPSAFGGGPGGGGGFTQVHMTLVDELLGPLSLVLAGGRLPAVAKTATPTSTVGGSAKLAEIRQAQAQVQLQLQLHQRERTKSAPSSWVSSLPPPAYAASPGKEQEGQRDSKQLASLNKTKTTTTTMTSPSALPAQARVEVEDAFMRLFLGTDSDDEPLPYAQHNHHGEGIEEGVQNEDEDEEEEEEETLPSYADALREDEGGCLLLGAGVPTFCKV